VTSNLHIPSNWDHRHPEDILTGHFLPDPAILPLLSAPKSNEAGNKKSMCCREAKHCEEESTGLSELGLQNLFLYLQAGLQNRRLPRGRFGVTERIL
jgi:hypothetical protein